MIGSASGSFWRAASLRDPGVIGVLKRGEGDVRRPAVGDRLSSFAQEPLVRLAVPVSKRKNRTAIMVRGGQVYPRRSSRIRTGWNVWGTDCVGVLIHQHVGYGRTGEIAHLDKGPGPYMNHP